MKRIVLLVAIAFILALSFASPASAQEFTLDVPILPKPEMIINPAPPIALVTQMPVWLAVKDWDTVDTLEGPAVPESVTYDMGDGHSITCQDKGVVWDKSLGNNQSTTCSYVYTRSSASAPNGSFDIKGHITYKLGDRDVDGTPSTLHVVVSEIQALNVSPNVANTGNVPWDQSKSPENHDNGGRSGLLGAIADFVGSAVDAIGNALGMTASAIGSFIKGFAIGVVDLAKGLWQLAELAYRLGPTRMMIDPVGWAKDVNAFLEVAAQIIGHPVDSLKAIGKDAVRWDTFADGKYAQGLGELLPNLLLIVASKGAGSLGKAATLGRTEAELAAAKSAAAYASKLGEAGQKVGMTEAQLAAYGAQKAESVSMQVPAIVKNAPAEEAAATRLAAEQKAIKDAGVDAHFFDRHGADVTLEQLAVRAKTGLTPDGKLMNNIPDSTRFLSHDMQQSAYDKVMAANHPANGAIDSPIEMGEIVGDGFSTSGQYGTSSQVTAVFRNGKLFTMYPLIGP